MNSPKCGLPNMKHPIKLGFKFWNVLPSEFQNLNGPLRVDFKVWNVPPLKVGFRIVKCMIKSGFQNLGYPALKLTCRRHFIKPTPPKKGSIYLYCSIRKSAIKYLLFCHIFFIHMYPKRIASPLNFIWWEQYLNLRGIQHVDRLAFCSPNYGTVKAAQTCDNK